ncbi:MAG: hypothetical protein NXH95_15920 [Pseudomonadaceae bacterium]|nr:hypothetical protein [Pseudomonadaceae bacterium]
MPDLPPDLKRAHDAFTTMYDALRSLTYHRALLEVGAGESKLWLHTRAQYIRIFVIEWTKLFGTDSNEVHWKKLVKEVPAFRSHVLQAAGITEQQWSEYWLQLRNFRDKVVAHIDPFSLPDAVPDMTIARAVLIAGYQWIREETIRSGVEHKGPKDIEQWAMDLHEEALDLLGAAVEATKGMSEEN